MIAFREANLIDDDFIFIKWGTETSCSFDLLLFLKVIEVFLSTPSSKLTDQVSVKSDSGLFDLILEAFLILL